MYPSQLSQIIQQSTDRLQRKLTEYMPLAAPQIMAWMQALTGGRPLGAYFTHPVAFPSLLLPWWAEQQISSSPDFAFQANLAYSTINGYLYIRLIDNLMDGDTATEIRLLPALGFFHTQFQQAYTPTFVHHHPFWQAFTQTWFHSAQVTMQDAQLTTINAEQFWQVAGQKVCAAKIPLAAVCYRYNRPYYIEPWNQVVDTLGCWHQMYNDLFDWLKDDRQGNTTYFLSEANRRRSEAEPLVAWIAREGLAWGVATLNGWMAELNALAHELDNPALITYLNTRQTMLLKHQEKAAKGLEALAKLTQGNTSGSRE